MNVENKYPASKDLNVAYRDPVPDSASGVKEVPVSGDLTEGECVRGIDKETIAKQSLEHERKWRESYVQSVERSGGSLAAGLFSRKDDTSLYEACLKFLGREVIPKKEVSGGDLESEKKAR